MKKLIYISGIVSANMMLLGSMFKVMHWPGAGILLTLSIFILCFIFLPFALISSYKNSSPHKYGLLYVVTYFVFFIVFTGALFKVQHWPGAAILLVFGVPLPFVLFLPVYLIQTRKDKNYSMVNFLGIMFGMTFVAVFSALLSLNVSRNILKNFENQFYYNQNLVSNVYSGKECVYDQSLVRQKSDELCTFIESLKDKMLLASGNNPKKIPNSEIMLMDNTEIPSGTLLNRENNNVLDELETKITSFKEAVISSEKAGSDLKELANKLFDVSDNITENNFPWEKKEFIDFKLIVVIDALTRLESNVKFVEREWSVTN
jgi:hypothetical protein